MKSKSNEERLEALTEKIRGRRLSDKERAVFDAAHREKCRVLRVGAVVRAAPTYNPRGAKLGEMTVVSMSPEAVSGQPHGYLWLHSTPCQLAWAQLYDLVVGTTYVRAGDGFCPFCAYALREYPLEFEGIGDE